MTPSELYTMAAACCEEHWRPACLSCAYERVSRGELLDPERVRARAFNNNERGATRAAQMRRILARRVAGAVRAKLVGAAITRAESNRQRRGRSKKMSLVAVAQRVRGEKC